MIGHVGFLSESQRPKLLLLKQKIKMKRPLLNSSLVALIPALLQGCSSAQTPHSPSFISDIEFTDPTFAQCISHSNAKDLTDITQLDCSSWGIHSVDEIRLMPNLQILRLSNNHIKSIDTSANQNLQELVLSDNPITDIDVSHNHQLTKLFLSNARLTSVDVSHNPLLEALMVGNNDLTEIDVSNNLHLKRLNIDDNKITSVNLKGLDQLTAMYAYKNPISALDVSGNTALKDLGISRHHLTELDLSHNPHLRSLNVTTGELQALDLSHNPKLLDLRASNNALDSITLPTSASLRYINVQKNNLTALDTSTVSALTELHAGQNKLFSVNLGTADNLKTISLNHNQLTQLDLSSLTNPESIVLFNNPLETIKLPIDFNRNTLSADNTPWAQHHAVAPVENPEIEVLGAGFISQHNGRFEVVGPALVLADIGDYVGMQYSVRLPQNADGKKQLPRQFAITVRVTHPTITPPNGGKPFTVSSWGDNMYLNDYNLAMWQFTENWELVEGKWLFEVIYQDKVVAKEAILVQKMM